MKARYSKGLLALAVLAPLAAAGFAPGLTVQPQSRLWVDGTSTVRSFTCQAPSFDARIESTSPEAVSLVLSGEKAVGAVAVDVPAEKLDCGNGTMNDHMFKALKADKHPTIAFRLASYDLVKAADGTTVKMSGRLSLGGTEKAIVVDATARPAANGMLQLTGSEEILLSDYGLKAPSLMMGTMKVGDKVKVGFDLILKP